MIVQCVLILLLISVLDTNDRFLRGITVGKGPNEKGHERDVSYLRP